MGVRKLSNSKSDLQGYSRALAVVPFNKPHTISYQCLIATIYLSCTVNEILSLVTQNIRRSRDTSHITCWAWSLSQCTVSQPAGGYKSSTRRKAAITFRQACSYLPSHRASQPLGRHQVTLLGDSGT